MNALPIDESALGQLVPAQPPRRSIIGRFLLSAGALLLGIGCYAAHEHFRLLGETGPALATLVAAGVLVMVPIRTLVGAFFAVERRFLHVGHGLGGLAIVGLTAGGAISGGPLLDHAAMAPFAIMGAAQALMHANHPRDAAQATALRSFVQSLRGVQQIADSRASLTPGNVGSRLAAIQSIVGKAQALGETELRSDPGFQGALKEVTTRFGVTLALDSAERALNSLASDPAAARSVSALRQQLDRARRLVDPVSKRAPATSHG